MVNQLQCFAATATAGPANPAARTWWPRSCGWAETGASRCPRRAGNGVADDQPVRGGLALGAQLARGCSSRQGQRPHGSRTREPAFSVETARPEPIQRKVSAVIVSIELQQLRCRAESDSNGSQPYLWVERLQVDDDTLSSTALVASVAWPPPPAGAQVVIHEGMRAGQSAPIPDLLARLGAQFRPGQRTRDLIIVAALWDRRDTPFSAVLAGYEAFLPEVRDAVAANVLALAGSRERLRTRSSTPSRRALRTRSKMRSRASFRPGTSSRPGLGWKSRTGQSMPGSPALNSKRRAPRPSSRSPSERVPPTITRLTAHWL